MVKNQKKESLRLTDGTSEQKSTDIILAPDQYETLHLLHRGDEAEIWLWRRRSDNLLLAVKSYRNKELDWQDDVPMERYILTKVLPPNPCVVRCPSLRILTDGQLEMAFEYYEGGDLGKLVRRAELPLPENLLWHVFIQMADALVLLPEETLTSTASADHGLNSKRPGQRPKTWQPVVHAAVKPSNIFCRQEYKPGGKFPSLVLGDFSLAFLGHSHSGRGGPSMYQPPEYPFVSARTDIWALGATIYALAHGEENVIRVTPADRKKMISAHRGKDRTKLIHAWLAKTKFRDAIRLPGDYSMELDHCVKACLEADEDERIDSKDLVKKLPIKKEYLEDRRARLKRAREEEERLKQEEDEKLKREKEKQQAREQEHQERKLQGQSTSHRASHKDGGPHRRHRSGKH